MTATPNYMTPDGYKRLRDELHTLLAVERPHMVQAVSDAAAMGDRSENAEYIYGKRRLREIDRRIRFLEKRLGNVEVVDPRTRRGDRIFFGATVVIEDDDGGTQTLMLVGEDEIDAEGTRVSWRSPVGRALLGKSEGDEVSVETPKGLRHLIVVEVRYE